MNATPVRALVQPRAYSKDSADPIPLVDIVSDLIYSDTRAVRLIGCGKSSALSHLASHFEDHPGIRFLDDEKYLSEVKKWDLTIFASHRKFDADFELKVANWSQDDVIEYLVSKSPNRCKSVMARINESNDLWLGNGSPRVLSNAVDLMIESDDVQSIEEGILQSFDSIDLTDWQRLKITYTCINCLFDSRATFAQLIHFNRNLLSRTDVQFLSNQPVRYVIAARHIAKVLKRSKKPKILARRWPSSFVEMVASRIASSEKASNFLNSLVNKVNSEYSPMAASLLIQNESNWKPTQETFLNLQSSHLEGVSWNNIVLTESFLDRADFSNAKLREADLNESTLKKGHFQGADLEGAKLCGIHARRANFSKANLQNCQASTAEFSFACFEDANLRYGDFTRANFSHANLIYTDLSFSNLTSAFLQNATLRQTILPAQPLTKPILSFQIYDPVTCQVPNLEMPTSAMQTWNPCLSTATNSSAQVSHWLS